MNVPLSVRLKIFQAYSQPNAQRLKRPLSRSQHGTQFLVRSQHGAQLTGKLTTQTFFFTLTFSCNVNLQFQILAMFHNMVPQRV